MFDDLTSYYHENVVSAYIDYRNIKRSGTAGRSRDIRSAIAAATALFHLREHLPEPNKLSQSATERQCPEYALIADIVNAAKHKKLDRKTPHGAPLLNDAAQIGEQVVITEYKDKDGEYRFAEKTVIVKLLDGSTRDLFEVLTVVLNYWENFLCSRGIINTARTFSDNSNNHPKNRKECEQNNLGFEVVQGQRFHQVMRLQRYNYQTGSVDPVDLSDSQLKCRIYKPNYEIDLSLTHDASGNEFKKTITLNEEENQELIKFITEEDRQAYINSLPSAQEAMHQLAVEAGLINNSVETQNTPNEENT